MPNETRQPDPLEARAKEIAREYFAYLRGQQTYPPMIALERMVLAALRTVQQETERATWERAIEFVQQLPRAEAIGVMSGMLDRTYRRTKPLSEIRELVAATPLEDQR